MSETLEARVARLEERLAWFERHVTDQDKVILEQAELLETIRKELLRLRDQSREAEPESGDERPPHY